MTSPVVSSPSIETDPSSTADRATPGQEVLTPTIRGGLRHRMGWIILVLVALLIAGVSILLGRGAAQAGVSLGPDDASPVGARALVKVLGQQGVEVRATESLDETRDAVGSPDDTTILLIEDDVELDADQHRELLRLADRIVLITPAFPTLNDLGVPISAAGDVDGTGSADCDLPAVQKAGRVLLDGSSYRLDSDADGVECLGSDDDRYLLVQTEVGGVAVTALGARDALSNQRIVGSGNAALALNLLGETDRLVWYMPGSGDVSTDSVPSFADQTPAIVAPLVLLAIALTVVAGVWRGRRFGPLVVERLPVTVPASETMEGRARLYQRGSSRLRALDSLRIGTISRLASAAGLSRTATVDEVIDATSALLGRDRVAIAAALVDAQPGNDAELVRLSDDLLTLERDVAAAVRG